MKKLLSALLLTVCLISAVTAFADFQNPSVNDGAGFLTPEETSRLEQTLDSIREAYNFDIAVVTESEMSGSDAKNTADDIFDYQHYGVDESADGILFYVSEEPRKYHITTHGIGIAYFTDRRLIDIEDAFLPYLKQNDYYGAFNEFALKCDDILNYIHSYDSYDSSDSYDYSDYDDSPYKRPIPPLIVVFVLLFPLLVAFIAMGTKLSKMNTAVKRNYASDYIKPGSMMNMTSSNDIFLYSTVTQTAKPQQDNDSSSTHTSSSGETHGGRGGSY